MILDTGEKQYKVIREVFCGEKNDVVVCQELHTAVLIYKTVWIIRNRDMARLLLEEFAQRENKHMYETCFTRKENLYFVLPYHQERPLHKFYMSTGTGMHGRKEKIWLELVTQCMTCQIPDSLLYLIFSQNQIQLGEDGSIHFGFFLDLSEYDEKKENRDCVTACARQLLALVRQEAQQPNMASQLLEKKLGRADYTEYIYLYKDIKLIAENREKRNIREELRNQIKRNKDRCYRVLFTLSSMLLVLVISMLVSRLIFGDFSFYKIFSNSLEQIGTESLLQ